MAYFKLAEHYDSFLRTHGERANGADWSSQTDRETRLEVMLDLLEGDASPHIDLLDAACGAGDMLRYIRSKQAPQIRYHGIDSSAAVLNLARAKFPEGVFSEIDLVQAPDERVAMLATDYAVINGLFTVKGPLSDDEMWSLVTHVVTRLWDVARKGIAFNLMSKHVDSECADLFHVSFDELAEFLHPIAGRNIVFRADYSACEYTCFAFKRPRRSRTTFPARLTTRSDLASADSPQLNAGTDTVCRPLLPIAEHLISDLKSIDKRRWYSNWGELNRALEEGLCAHFGFAERGCVTASSGTDAITAALIAVAGRGTAARPYCLMPSYTFVATAVAALNAGYTPYFVDMNPDTLALDPGSLISHPALRRAGAIVVVAPYGKPVDALKWRTFLQETGVPVVIDAAAGFDAVASKQLAVTAEIPVALSFHATKVFGTGEGGAILSGDAELAQRCRRVLNFGMLGDRRSIVAGINGKLSEYHAAVGLAELRNWPKKRADFLRVADAYWRAALNNGLDSQLSAESGWASSYVLYVATTAAAANAAIGKLSAAGIDYRYWYGRGVHLEPGYADFPADALPVTENLSDRLIGLPVSIDLADSAINRVIDVLAKTGG
jgi:dTDP-4-amino-4,6-dideoxygalactose transaminase